MSRKTARETALKLVYEFIISGRKNELTYKNLTSSEDFSSDDLSYIADVYNGTTDKYDEILAIIEKNTEGYRTGRIYKVDLAILVLSVFEICFYKGISGAVSANEAVELAKTFSAEKSYSFVNGVLAKIIAGVNAAQ